MFKYILVILRKQLRWRTNLLQLCRLVNVVSALIYKWDLLTNFIESFLKKHN